MLLRSQECLVFLMDTTERGYEYFADFVRSYRNDGTHEEFMMMLSDRQLGS